MIIEEMIHGINPSIAKIVYYLNKLGYQTITSHAGFFPGDPEEQEYWIQKEGIMQEFGKELHGPIVLIGVFIDVPYVGLWLTDQEYLILENLLPKYWTFEQFSHQCSECATKKPQKRYLVKYNHPDLIKFTYKFGEIYNELIGEEDLHYEKFFEELDEFQSINQEIISKLPLSNSEYNRIRNNGIRDFEKILERYVPKITKENAKIKIDAITGAKNYYRREP